VASQSSVDGRAGLLDERTRKKQTQRLKPNSISRLRGATEEVAEKVRRSPTLNLGG
jgi:hypothetical protein